MTGNARAHAKKHHSNHQPAHVLHFVRMHSADARLVAAKTGVPIEVILAQSALESDWGRSVKGNAYFGIKGKSPTGDSTSFATREVTPTGEVTSAVSEFRAYTDYAEAANDYAALIQRKYPLAMLVRKDPMKFAEAVATQGYATDPHYAIKLKSIIRAHIAPLLGR